MPERGRAAAAAALLVALIAPSRAHAGWWTPPDGDAEEEEIGRVRFSPRFSFWAGTFDRPSRACRSFATPGDVPTIEPTIDVAEAVALPPGGGGGFCQTNNSDEVGIGAAAEVAFRVTGPLHLTASIELLYTFPERDYALKNQVIVPLSFGILFTFDDWIFRPILAAHITPLLYLTDDTRDFTAGGELGFGWRLWSWGDASLTVSKHFAETADLWQVQLGLHPL